MTEKATRRVRGPAPSPLPAGVSQPRGGKAPRRWPELWGAGPQPQQGTDPLDPQQWGNRGTEGGRAGDSLVSPGALRWDGASSARGLQGWWGSVWGQGLSAEGALGRAPQLWRVHGVGRLGCLCVTKAVRRQLGVSPREPVLEAGMWGVHGQLGPGGESTLGPCPGIPRAGTVSGCQPGWDSHVGVG